MDDAEFAEIRSQIDATPDLILAVAADILDAIDPAVEPFRRFAAVKRAAERDNLRGLLYVTTLACGMVTHRFQGDPEGQAAYMRQLRSYVAGSAVADDGDAP